MKVCLTVDSLPTLSWWVDASYAVYWDSRSHAGMAILMGLEAAISGSWKQKLNTGSLTEAEPIGIDTS